MATSGAVVFGQDGKASCGAIPKPKRRKRKRLPSNLSEDQKGEIRKQNNRRAAQDLRDRRRQYEEALEVQVRALEGQEMSLQDQVARLEADGAGLRREVERLRSAMHSRFAGSEAQQPSPPPAVVPDLSPEPLSPAPTSSGSDAWSQPPSPPLGFDMDFGVELADVLASPPPAALSSPLPPAATRPPATAMALSLVPVAPAPPSLALAPAGASDLLVPDLELDLSLDLDVDVGNLLAGLRPPTALLDPDLDLDLNLNLDLDLAMDFDLCPPAAAAPPSTAPSMAMATMATSTAAITTTHPQATSHQGPAALGLADTPFVGFGASPEPAALSCSPQQPEPLCPTTSARSPAPSQASPKKPLTYQRLTATTTSAFFMAMLLNVASSTLKLQAQLSQADAPPRASPPSSSASTTSPTPTPATPRGTPPSPTPAARRWRSWPPESPFRGCGHRLAQPDEPDLASDIWDLVDRHAPRPAPGGQLWHQPPVACC